MPFAPEYVRCVLGQNFEDAKTLFLGPLLDIHRAHLVMLVETGIVSRAEGRLIRQALDGIAESELREVCFDGTVEDLFFHVERLLCSACGDEIAGRLHTARSRNDIDMTMYRMRQREFLLTVAAATLELRESLLDLAAAHRGTLMAAHTHTQPAQPTSLAHYLLGVVEQLERDLTRLQAAFASTNRSPLGACAITGTGFPIDRSRTSDLLGFAGPTGNTYGSIATVDYLLESMGAVAVLAVGLGRFVQDLLLWGTAEVGYLRFSDGFVQSSSIMPQKRNPVAIEHARAIGSRALGQAQAVALTVHNTPFGDVVDTEDDLQPVVAAVFEDVRKAVTLVAAAMRGASFDVDRMAARAAAGGTTMTELADTLAREQKLSFKTAHAIVSRVLEAQARNPEQPLADVLGAVCLIVLGRPVGYSPERLAEILSADYFVRVRRTPGGPAPEETARAVDASRDRLSRDRLWTEGRQEDLHAARERLLQASAAL